MCQLFALDSAMPTSVCFPLSGFVARGGATADHVDGWGVAFHDDEGGCRRFVDAGRASDSALARHLCRHPIPARHIVAHVRRATQGAVAAVNCHPFRREWRGRSWTFCHNGDLKNFHPALDAAFAPVGATDSERAFCWLMQQLQHRFASEPAPTWQALAPVVAELAGEIARHGVFNFLLCDGRAICAHASTRLHWLQRRAPFGRVRLVDRDAEIDLALTHAGSDRAVLMATEPLTLGEAWVAFERGEMRVFSGGQSIWHGCTQSVPATAAAEATETAVIVEAAAA